MKHPEKWKWYIVATEENYDELCTWRKAVASSTYNEFEIGHPLLSKHPSDASYYYGGSVDSLRSDSDYDDYQEITLEEFRQITNPTSKQKAISETIRISRHLLNEYYEASTTDQKAYLVEHFKLDGTTTASAIYGLHDIACDTWKSRIKENHPDCFPKESKYFDFSDVHRAITSVETAERLGLAKDFIQVRNNKTNPETHKCSFYLSPKYNWELKQDGSEDDGPVFVLIPTKK